MSNALHKLLIDIPSPYFMISSKHDPSGTQSQQLRVVGDHNLIKAEWEPED